MITFLVLYWIINTLSNIFEFLFHPIRSIGGSGIFKIVLGFLVIIIWLSIFMLIASLFIFVVIFLLLFDLFKYLYECINKKKKSNI